MAGVFIEGESDKTALDRFKEQPNMAAIAAPNLDVLKARQDQKVDLTHLPEIKTPDLDAMRLLRDAKATKLMPILLPIPNEPLPPREVRVWPLGELGGASIGRNGSTGSPNFPLKLVRVSDTSFKVLAGEVGGFAISETTYTSVTTTKYVWVEVTQGYSTGTGIWTPSAAALGTPAGSYGSPSAAKQIVQLGYVTCAGSVITAVSPMVSGSQMVAREGSGSNYADRNDLV